MQYIHLIDEIPRNKTIAGRGKKRKAENNFRFSLISYSN
jgi:hypothetical protein